MKKIPLLFLGLILTLPACTSNTRDSSPTLATDGIQLQQKKVAVDPLHAKVIMKASGDTVPVEFSIRRAADADPRMDVQGTVVDTGRGKVFGWIAKLNETVHSATLKHFPQLEVLAEPDQLLEVSGVASGQRVAGYYRCGPLKSAFKPQRGKVYLVEFQFVGSLCEQHVYDVTSPPQRIPFATDATDSASKG
jgi:hypothetical protein